MICDSFVMNGCTEVLSGCYNPRDAGRSNERGVSLK